MNSYKNIPLWENARRRRVLVEFRNNVFSYSNTDATQARRRINLTVDQAHCIIVAAGITPIRRRMAPALGVTLDINVIVNLFDLHENEMSENCAVD